jgi:hypothetical protein
MSDQRGSELPRPVLGQSGHDVALELLVDAGSSSGSGG